MTFSSLADVERTAVIGAGEIDRGIGAVSALAGYETTITDIDEEQLVAAMDHAG